MFQKTGDLQPLDVVHTCCKCEMAASMCVDDKYYCDAHKPQAIQTELPLENEKQ